MIEHRSLLLRSNRFLGSALVNRNLISVEDLELANQKLLEMIQSNNLKQASILNILLYEMNALEENELINAVVDTKDIGLVDLRNYDIEAQVDLDLDLGLCWATWALPFDEVDGYHFMATSNILSEPAVKAWQEKLGGDLIWYLGTVESISNALGRVDERFHQLQQIEKDRLAEQEAAAASTSEPEAEAAS